MDRYYSLGLCGTSIRINPATSLASQRLQKSAWLFAHNVLMAVSPGPGKKLSKELEKRDMLIPDEIILDTIVEDRADIPINAIHMYSRLKAELYPVREGDELRQSAFQRQQQVDYDHPML